MPSRWWSAAVVGLIAATLPAPAGAQTSDIVFGAWSWRSRDPGSRPAGLGGAYVAVADSIRTAAVNPAGLALIPKAELAAGTANLWAGIGYSLRRAATPAGPVTPLGPVAGPDDRPSPPSLPSPAPPRGRRGRGRSRSSRSRPSRRTTRSTSCAVRRDRNPAASRPARRRPASRSPAVLRRGSTSV